MTRVRLEIIGAEQLRALAGRFSIPAAYPDYRDQLSDPVGAPAAGILPGKGSC